MGRNDLYMKNVGKLMEIHKETNNCISVAKTLKIYEDFLKVRSSNLIKYLFFSIFRYLSGRTTILTRA